MMNYIQLLEGTARQAGNCTCLGIDPNFSALPEGLGVRDFYLQLFEEIDKAGLKVASVKPNIGYFSRLDKPLEGDFGGSLALADVVKAFQQDPSSLIQSAETSQPHLPTMPSRPSEAGAQTV